MNHTLLICAHTFIKGKNRHIYTFNTVKSPDSPEMSRLEPKTTNLHKHTIYTQHRFVLLYKMTSKTSVLLLNDNHHRNPKNHKQPIVSQLTEHPLTRVMGSKVKTT